MADEPVITDAPTDEPKQQVVFNSQADFDAVIQNRLAKEKAKYTDYDTTKDELEKLRQEKKERDELELSELDKAKKQAEESKLEIDRLKTFETKDIERTKKLEESFDKKLDESDLSDEEKDLFTGLPVEKKIPLLEKVIASKTVTPPSSAGKYPGVGEPTKEQILAMDNGPAKTIAWTKFRNAGGV